MTAFDPRQRHASHLETAQTSHDGRQAQLHTAMPATVVSWNPAANTVNVQPAIKGIRTRSDGTIHTVKIAELHDVPVCFQGGGGHMLTFPIQPGDDCLIIFAERSIDHWWQLGTLNPPSDWRMHDINDGFALVGVRSLPKVPGGGAATRTNAGAAISPDTVNLRSDDGQTVVQVDGPNNAITLYAGAGANESVVFVDGKGQNVTVRTATSVVLDTPLVTITGQLSVTGTRGTGSSVATIQGDVHVNGEVWGKFSTAPVSLTQHIHHAVNTPPAIGTRAAEEPPVITGSYGDIPALKNLLQFLQSRGDIVDNST